MSSVNLRDGRYPPFDDRIAEALTAGESDQRDTSALMQLDVHYDSICSLIDKHATCL